MTKQSSSRPVGSGCWLVVGLAAWVWVVIAPELLAQDAPEAAANKPLRSYPESTHAETEVAQPGAPAPVGPPLLQARPSELQPVRRPGRSDQPAGHAAGGGSMNARSSGGPSTQPWYRSGFIALTVVLLLIIGSAIAVKRFLPGTRRLNSGVLEIVSRTYLSPKQSVALIKMGSQLVLIGITPDHISALAVTNDPDKAAELTGLIESSKSASVSSAFSRWLAGETGRFRDSEGLEVALEGTSAASYMQARGQLRGALEKVRSRLARQAV